MATRVAPPPPLTIDIAAATSQLKNGSIPPPPQTAALTGNGAGSPSSPGFFHPKKQYQYHQQTYHHLQRAEGQVPPTSTPATEFSYWASPPSSSSTLVATFSPSPFGSTKELRFGGAHPNGDSAVDDQKNAHYPSDGAYHTAIKVDSIYHPQQHAFPKQQAYIQKFNSYTTGSRLSRQGSLVSTLTPTTTTTLAALQAVENEKYHNATVSLEDYQFPPAPGSVDHGQYVPLDVERQHHHHPMDHPESPGSPMSMTCPPPYQRGGGMYALERSSSTEKLPLTSMGSSNMARLKLARLSSTSSAVQAVGGLPPMAIPISTEASADALPGAADQFKENHGAMGDDSTRTAHRPRTGGIIDADDESLYNLRVSEDESEAPEVKPMDPSHVDTMRMGAMLPRYSRNRIAPLPSTNGSTTAGTVMGPSSMSSAAMAGTVSARMASVQEPLQLVQFPSFWQDAKQHQTHWAFFSMGAILLASGAWIATMQVFAPWVIILPIMTLSVLGLQYGNYRWKRAKFQRRQREECQRRQRATTILFSDRPRRHGPWLHDLDTSAAAPSPSAASAAASSPAVNQGEDQPSPAYTPRAASSSMPAQPPQPRSAPSPPPQWPSMSPHAPIRQNQQFLTVDGPASSSSSSSMLHLQTPQTPPPAYCLKRLELPEMDLGENLTLSFDVNRFSM
ncbi:hypothetical protein BGZ73_004777 [Actinomortierella ambigua]|nr:hypothetical protein BGZ73_004777 [Actinomortierella ambigua]